MTDQQNANTLGCYGNPVIRTPNMDRSAGEGVLIENAYVTTPVCVPSRASIWSARYPHCNGVMVNDGGRRDIRLDPSIATLGDVAKAAGYSCGYFGKWHIGHEQTPQHGFTDAWWTHLRGSYEQDLEESAAFRFEPVQAPTRLGQRLAQRGQVPFELAHDTAVTTRTIDFIREHAERPFVAVCSMRAPHDPYIGPFDGLYDPADVLLPPTLGETFQGKPALQARGVPRDWFRRWAMAPDGTLDERGLREVIARYWGMVHMIDLNVGRLLDALDELGLAERTVVVFMSDHGEMMGAHGLMSKGCFMYEDATRVPLILRHTGALPAGARATHLASAIDVVPTLLDLMGLAKPDEMQGITLRQYWDYAFNVRDAVFLQIWETYGLFDPILAVRTERWKYSWHLADMDELYDLEEDPHEMRNLATDQANADAIRGLRSRIQDWLVETGDIPISTLAKFYKGFNKDFG
jgi:arylsulfatase A-like enzyme